MFVSNFETEKSPPMHDLLIAFFFVAMLVLPCIAAMRTDSTEEAS